MVNQKLFYHALNLFCVWMVSLVVGLIPSIAVAEELKGSLATAHSDTYPAQDPCPTVIPAQILDLNMWKVTLPVDEGRLGNKYNSADEVYQPALHSFSDKYFYVEKGCTAVIFRAPVNGARTTSTSYPRSELREMTGNGKKNASWATGKGLQHILDETVAITHLPVKKPELVFCQIHGSSNSSSSKDILQCLAKANKDGTATLTLRPTNHSKTLATLDKSYVLGTPIQVQIKVIDSKLKVYYNSNPNADPNGLKQKLNMTFKDKGLYFKAGNYTQSNSEKEGLSKDNNSDDPSIPYGETAFYKLTVTHITKK
jgi:hypothetical protein